MGLDSKMPPYMVDGYFPPPYSVSVLPDSLRRGLIALGLFAGLSVVSLFLLLLFMTYRIVMWRKYYKVAVGLNQNLALVYNLLVADFLQSSSLVISFHWLRVDGILAPTGQCRVQAGLMTVGDLASGMFTLFIAIHTMLAVLYRRKLPNAPFFWGVGACWFFAAFLTAMGPALHSWDYFARAGAWCWAARAYSIERLGFHLIWIFIFQTGIMVIYAVTFISLKRQIATTSIITRSARTTNQARVNRATYYMVLYPLAYVICTLPIAAGRISAMASNGSKDHSDTFYAVTGSLLTSCGWIDAILYALTRHVLVSHANASHQRPSNAPPTPRLPTLTGYSTRAEQEWVMNDLHVSKPRMDTVITGSPPVAHSWKDKVLGPDSRIGKLRRGKSCSGGRSGILGRSNASQTNEPTNPYLDKAFTCNTCGRSCLGGVKTETTVEIKIEQSTRRSFDTLPSGTASAGLGSRPASEIRDEKPDWDPSWPNIV